MAYEPIQSPKWSERDALPQGDQRKIIKAADFDTEFRNISAEFKRIESDSNSQIMASCKYNGSDVRHGYNVDRVEQLENGHARVWFKEPINFDEPIQLPDGSYANPGDFCMVVQPYTSNGRHAIATITDQREAYVDIAFAELKSPSSGEWQAPSPNPMGFAMILIDQVPG